MCIRDRGWASMGGEDLEKLDVTVDDEAVYSDTRTTLEQARKTVSHAVNAAMVGAYWEIGRRIQESPAYGCRKRRATYLVHERGGRRGMELAAA